MTFLDLAASRRDWIAGVLIPWCRQAPLLELRKAADEWHDIAGRVDPERTLWLWAWSRFPALYVDGLPGLDETYEVELRTRTGEEFRGFPNARGSQRGRLLLQGGDGPIGPFSIDDVVAVRRATDASTHSMR